MIRNLLSILPVRVSASIYQRWIRRFQHWLPGMFHGAPLKHVPSIRMNLKPTDVAHGEIAFLGCYERRLADTIVNLARTEGGTLLDVGANYGYFSLLWCGAAPSNRAIAIEASADNVAALRENIALNQLNDRIEVHEFAATNYNGEISFDLGPAQQTGWGGIVVTPTTGSTVVKAQRLDDAFAGRHFAVAKIDCEGADTLVLDGLSGHFCRHLVSHVFFEYNPYRMKALALEKDMATDALKGYGYDLEEMTEHSGEHDPREYHAHLPVVMRDAKSPPPNDGQVSGA